MGRIVVVYNPRSSQAKKVEDEVLSKLSGSEHYEVKDTDVDDNAGKLAEMLVDGDLIITAGGDATATIGLNGAMLSEKDVTFAALPYGNFNDAANGLGLKSVGDVVEGNTKKAWALDCLLDDKHYRYGLCYFTVGMFAEATEIFDHPKYRKKLREMPSIRFSIQILAKWWMKNRKKEFLPEEFLYNGRVVKKMTDYVALNSSNMARLLRGKRWFLEPKIFRSRVGRLSNLAGLISVIAPSVVAKLQGEDTERGVLEFDKKFKAMIQGEGEYKTVETKKIEVRKAERWIKVVVGK